MTLFEAFCEKFEDQYQEFLIENEMGDSANAQESFALMNESKLADFEINYNDDLINEEADMFNDWLKAEGE
jgi:hypothetical protein